MTNPAPYPDPHLPLYLHGDPRIASDVSIVWRADLTDADLADEERAIAIVAAMPPSPGEALQLPIAAARRFLHRRSDDGSDAPEREEDLQGAGNAGGRMAVAWRGKDFEIIDARDIRPGDTLVVPASYGGCDQFGVAPESAGAVVDIADRAAGVYQKIKRRIVRLHSAVWTGRGVEDDAQRPPWSTLASLISAAPASSRRIPQWLDEVLSALKAARSDGSGKETALEKQLAELAARKPQLVWPYRELDGGVPQGVVVVAGTGTVESGDDDASSFTDRPQTLANHVAMVEKLALHQAHTLGLSAEIIEALRLAALHHDDGKRDQRFQQYLHSAAGHQLGTGSVDLAKSGARRPRAEDQRLRVAVGLPSQWRHEVLSARLFAERAPQDQPRAVLDLALWLIGSHHGQGRPFFRHADPWDDIAPIIGGETVPAGPGPHRLDFDWHGDAWADVFENLKRRYGVWGIAYLEAVLRLADHRASGGEREAADDGQTAKEAGSGAGPGRNQSSPCRARA